MSPKASHSVDEGARARAAQSNRPGRYERHDRDAFDDGWAIQECSDTVRTEVTVERPRKIITRNSSPDISFDRSINPYRGCEHGCIYCFARPTHAYLGMSPGLDFETRLIARPDAAVCLDRELRAKSYRPAPIAIGTNTDPYQPIEREHRIMRQVLGVLRKFKHPVTVVTKGTLIERDSDILGEMGQAGLAYVGVSVTTLDPCLSRAMEPRAPGPKRRLETIRRLSAAGVPVKAMVSPVIPGLTDHEIESVLQACADAGAVAAGWIMLRLPLEVSPLFQEWLAAKRPDRAARVMARVRETQGGEDYAPDWGRRMRGVGTNAKLIDRRFTIQISRLGLKDKLPDLRTDLFQPPLEVGNQLALF